MFANLILNKFDIFCPINIDKNVVHDVNIHIIIFFIIDICTLRTPYDKPMGILSRFADTLKRATHSISNKYYHPFIKYNSL